MRRLRMMSPLLAVLACSQTAIAQSADPRVLIGQVVANEVKSQTDSPPHWSYTLQKTNASGTKVTRIVETGDGLVGRLLSINGSPLDAVTERNEQHRLNELKRDPRQMRQKLARQERDRDRVLRIVRALPNAFLYSWQSSETGSSGDEALLTFKPNPAFQPDSFDTQILKAMYGTVRIALQQKRLIALHGKLGSDVSVGLGIVGRVQKGGTLDLEQTEISAGDWEITRMALKITGRAVFKHIDMSVDESASDFKPLKEQLTAPQAIDLLLANQI